MAEIEISDEMVEAFQGAFDACPQYDDSGYCCTRAGLAAALAGRLLPSGGEVSEEWGFRSVPDLGRPTTERRPTRALAEQMVAHFNRVYATRNTYSGRAELLRRVRIVWPDGGEYIGPWSPVLSDNSEVPNAD